MTDPRADDQTGALDFLDLIFVELSTTYPTAQGEVQEKL
jgi:hypothetical protein